MAALDPPNITKTSFALIKDRKIKFIDLKEKLIKDISHNLQILEDGQGGLLDILYKDGTVFVSYSENRSKGMSSTSVSRAKFSDERLNFKNIFQAQPPINSGYHFGSRLVIKKNHLYITGSLNEPKNFDKVEF